MTADTSSNDDKPLRNEQEPRNRGLESLASEPADPLSDNRRARIGVYLIEREAIWWRRQQWIEPGKLGRANAIDFDYLQKKYARPTAVTSPSAMQRAETWIKSKFGSK